MKRTPLKRSNAAARLMQQRAQEKLRAQHKAAGCYGAPIARVSAKQAKRNAAYYASKPTDPQPCVVCGALTTHEHHIAGRGIVDGVDMLLEPSNRVPCCDNCNVGDIHANSESARERGLLKSRHTSATKQAELKNTA